MVGAVGAVDDVKWTGVDVSDGSVGDGHFFGQWCHWGAAGSSGGEMGPTEFQLVGVRVVVGGVGLWVVAGEIPR